MLKRIESIEQLKELATNNTVQCAIYYDPNVDLGIPSDPIYAISYAHDRFFIYSYAQKEEIVDSFLEKIIAAGQLFYIEE